MPRILKLFSLFAMLLFVVGLVLTGCAGSGSKSKTAAPSGDTIKIGAILPMTGPAAVFGKKFQEAYTMAIEEINAQGGVKGKKLELLIEDSQEQPQLGTTAAEKLILLAP